MRKDMSMDGVETAASVGWDYVERLRIAPPSEEAARRARARLDAIAKPFGSLGLMEDVVVQMAALAKDGQVDISRRALVVACADNGVVAEGVSASGQEVTATMARCIARGQSSVARMCAQAGVDVVVVDVGMLESLADEGIYDRRVGAGTADIACGPAMTREQALQAIAAGVELVGELVSQGVGIVATGEMGIGNTTTATAMACAFSGSDPESLCGRGTGLDDAGLARKVEAIRRAIQVNRPDPRDPLDVLACLGGFDIAFLCGVFLGGGVHRVPVIADGLISTVAAWCATSLRPECAPAILASHQSAEPAAALVLARLGKRAPIHADMRLGEGTGAVSLIPLLDLALSVYQSAVTLGELEIVSYRKSDA